MVIQKTKPQVLPRRRSIFGFTLVELIVVITILAILGTIGFLSITSYSAKARDSVRISDMGTAVKALALLKIQADSFPIPEDALTVTSGTGTIISYQGYLGEGLSRMMKIDKVMVDPKDGSKYSYSIDATKKKVQLMGYLELGEIVRVMTLQGNEESTSPMSTTYASTSPTPFLTPTRSFYDTAYADTASSYSTRHIYVTGDQVGILTNENKAPLQEGLTGTGVNLSGVETTGMTAYFGGSAYGEGRSTGS